MANKLNLIDYDAAAAAKLASFFAEADPAIRELLPQIRIVQDTWLVRALGQGGVTMGTTIHLRGHFAKPPYTSFDRGLILAHECTHVGQYVRYGYLGFFARLLWQMIRVLGYEATEIEQEAERMENRFEAWHR